MSSDLNSLVLELTRAKETFKAFLAQPSSGESLASEILSSLDKSICMAESFVYLEGSLRPSCPDTSIEPPLVTKKRKTIAKSSSQERTVVKIGTGDGASGPIGDGYTWRKYGQKNIQYTKYPRGYYRCSHRDTRGCPAIKQMQLSSDNPTILEVTYLGSHTCHHQGARLESDEPELKKKHNDCQIQQQCQEPGSLSSSQTGLTIKTEVSGTELASTSFLFPNTPVSNLDLPSFNNCYTDLSAFENCFSASPCRSNSYAEGPFSFPNTPVSNLDLPSFNNCYTDSSAFKNCFSASPCRSSNYAEGPSLQIEEESNILTTNAVANSAFMDMDLLFNLSDLDDPNFTIL